MVVDSGGPLRSHVAVELKDHLGRTLTLGAAPRRLVSLVPSITETVVALGSAPVLVGRTEFCVHPEAALASVAVVGGTKTPDVARILALAPDLVLANQEENRAVDVKRLEREVPVFVTDVRTVAEALAWTEELRALLAGQPTAPRPERRRAPPVAGPRVATLVWREPLVAVGEDTYAASVLAAVGLANVFSEPGGRYPRPTLDDLAARRPERVVLPSEPHAWTEAEAHELEDALRARGAETRCVRVSGEALTWWGARTKRAVLELESALREVGS
jgi:ABC-type Fe3+-hydroxamate transport system substrate-binding protein